MTRANRLIHETSPYLLQHAQNPVDWYPWGEEALDRARAEDKPIFLSIGYAACHWCHVMERESFENEDIAALMNRHFVNIKVDREERPDLDEIYMKFVVATTGSGGWPMSVWLTPEKKPFLGGTYFPPDNRYGRASFPQVIDWVVRMWTNHRDRLEQESAKALEEIRRRELLSTEAPIEPGVLDQAFDALLAAFDPEWGGFGPAPKFPHATDIRLCLRLHRRTRDDRALQMATVTLDRMAAGGIRDHLGGGFARYSTDERWLVPHFEKMLYDNALLATAYAEAWQATGREAYRTIARETCDFVLREMSTPSGGFGSSLDADSEGEEGRFYVWTHDELIRVLGDDLGRKAAEFYDVTPGGNFENGRSVLWQKVEPAEVASRLGLEEADLLGEIEIARRKLLRAREARERPGYDDKILVAWNGLMISALARTAQIAGDPSYASAATRAARWILEGMRREDGRLFATAREGKSRHNATFDDYAFFVAALLDLYETDFDPRWVREALALDRIVEAHFEDRDAGGFFTTSDDHEDLILRLKSIHDGALPAGSGVYCENLLRLKALTGRDAFEDRARRAMESLGGRISSYPAAFSRMLCAVDMQRNGLLEAVVRGKPDAEDTRALLRAVREPYCPDKVVAAPRPDADEVIALLRGHPPDDGTASVTLCAHSVCSAPIPDPQEVRARLCEGPRQ